LEELAFRHPTSAYRAFELGLAYEKVARYEDALDAFERSVSLNPLDHLAREALERVGRTLEQRAREDLGKADTAIAGNRTSEAIAHFSSALQRLPKGKAKQDALLKLLRLVANMPAPPPLTEQGERHFARGNAMLKSATGPEGVDRAIVEFRSAIRRSPWWTNSYLNLGLAYAQRRLYRDAALYFKLYLIANPNAKNAGAVREQIYELEYKQEQEQRLPPLLSRLRYRKDYSQIVVQPAQPAEQAAPTSKVEKPAEQGGNRE
jgi:tetratricopeptide (TPR) repeat protein